MPKFRSLTRVLSTASRLRREEGLGGVVSAVWSRAELSARVLAARKTQSVDLDGCTFSFDRLPNTSMKLELLKKQYEAFERHAVLRYVRPDYPIIELGGCIGVVACVANRILDNPSAHIVVEANPMVIPLLQESKDRNHAGFEIITAAIAYDREAVTFSQTVDFMGNSLQAIDGSDTVTVNAVRLRDIIRERNIDSYTLICDIEGHEYDLVRLDADALEKADIIILETHARIIGHVKAAEVLSRLNDIGFKKLAEDSFVVVLGRNDGANTQQTARY
jgi:FkbM family methyltransferase